MRPSGMGTERRTTALQAVRALSNVPSSPMRDRNIVAPDGFSRFIRHGPLSSSSEFGRLRYLAFVFALRLKSEALPTARALPGDPLLPRTPHQRKSLIGLHMFGGDVRLVLKLAFRKNSRNVTIAMCPGF